ncbi:MAG: prolipoprotein diacylglyceryl transferase [Gammaproteobacteria bacterium]|nr:prolipoprotein diacylglyceryl transferase [Gammaproteobacteria bacterium]
MLHDPHFDPIAFHLGPLAVHWYGLMYLFGLMLAWCLARYRMKTQPWFPIKKTDTLSDLLFYAAMGVILGGRIGYMLFYAFPDFIHQPWIIFEVWDGGMSFHGGLIGVCLALFFFARKEKIAYFLLMDNIAPLVPIGLALGRLGNFINGELWGRVTNSPIGMIFPTGGPLPRYPSQLFELSLEGLLLFILLWTISLKKRRPALISAIFLIGYASARFFVEFFREPDPQLGYLAFGWLTMGQVLCIPMFLLGFFLLFWKTREKNSPT